MLVSKTQVKMRGNIRNTGETTHSVIRTLLYEISQFDANIGVIPFIPSKQKFAIFLGYLNLGIMKS